MKRKLVSLILILALLFPCLCLSAPVTVSAEENSFVSNALTVSGSKYVAVGKKVTLKASSTVTWKSSNKKIATVSSKGVVTGKKAGKVTITAKAKNGSSKAWKMTVTKKPVKSITITAPVKTLDLNGTKTVKLTAKASPSSAAQSFTWKSSNTKIATVSSAGKVTARAAGKVKITATATDGSEVKKEITLTVKDSSGGGKVGISMPTDMLQRWVMDGANLEAALKKAGFETELKYAGNDVSTQTSQIEAMIDSGCKVLVIAAVSGSSLSSVLAKAAKKGIAVISYDRLITNTDAVSYYVSFSNKKVGTLQGNYIVNALNLKSVEGPFNIEFTAGDPGDSNGKLFYDGAMDVMKPYIESGKLVVVSGQTAFDDVATSGWRTTVAQDRAEAILSAYYSDGTNLDAWLCVNDSTALGVTNALTDSYAGDGWPVITGQDCDISNVKNIIAGKQAMSVFKDSSILVSRTVKMIGQITNGETVDTNSKTDNGTISVPAYLCSPVVVDKGNYKKYLIDSGYYDESWLQ